MTYNSLNNGKHVEELQPLSNHDEPLYHQPPDIPKRTICDLVSFILYVLLSSAAFAAASISLGAGAYWFHAIKGKPMAECLVIMLTAALPLGLGIFFVVVIVAIVVVSACFTAMPIAGLSNRTCCSRILRVTSFHVVPFLALCIGIAGSIIALYFSSMAHQQPDLDKSFNVPGLDGPVTIRRDPNGLAHVSAASHRDALFGQGLAHGQDRLWQIEFQRLVGRGRLAEFVGSAASTMDKQIRTLGFPAGAQRMCNNASPENRALAQRYVDGLNFYVNNYKERPAEFLFMGKGLLKAHTVEPFEVMDCCLIAMLLMWQMGANVPTEIQRFKVFWSTDRSYDEVNELFINQTNITGTILTAEQLNLSEADAVAAREREANDEAIERALYDGYLTSLRTTSRTQSSLRGMKAQSPATSPPKSANAKSCDPLSFLMKEFDLLNFNVHHASNSWAGRASGGKPAVGASDPHLAINVPSVWYWSHLEWSIGANQTYDAAGVGLPGLPGVHIGKTTSTSWGITMSMTDLTDLFIITPDPTQPSTHYVVNGTSLPYTFRTEVIEVKGEDTITLNIQETIYGPIVTQALSLPDQIQFAIYADFLRNDTTSLNGLICLNDPQTTTAMAVRDDCLSYIRSPGFSIPIEDAQGNIAYSMTGAHPLRRAGHTGRYPIMGNGSFDYLGEIPFTELPTLTIPAAQSDAFGGYVSAANQKTYPDGYKYSLSYDFCYPYRGSRLHEVLSQNPSQLSDINFHMSLQRDVHSNIAADWLSILNDTTYPEVASFHQTLSGSAAAMSWYQRLNNWDLLMRIGNVEGTFFWLWWRELLATPRDAINALNTNSDSSNYWDSGQQQFPIYEITRPTETMTRQCIEFVSGSTGCGDMAAKIFINIANSFNEASSRWGIDYNQLTTKHLMLEHTPLNCLYQRTVNKDGDGSTIDVSDFQIDGNMDGSFASSMRQLYNWDQPDWIHFMFPGGESGNPFSQFFQNFLQPYSQDLYVNVTTTGDTIMGGAAFSQTLNP